MKVTFRTKDGKTERELTPQELSDWAKDGDINAKKEILKKDLSSASNTEQRLLAIEKYLGV